MSNEAMSNEERVLQLQALRQRIDELDEELLELLSRRGRLAQEVGACKEHDSTPAHYYRPEREAQVLRHMTARNPGPFADAVVARIFQEIISACRALEAPLTVAYLGPAGTFTEAAALRHFGSQIRGLPLPAIDAVFREVEAGGADYGVVPVENSTEGVVTHTLDMFMRSPLLICGEVELRIHHCLLAAGGTLDAVARVCSHQQSLAQCRGWLDANLPRAERVAVASNAEAARRAAQEPGTAAIAGEVAAQAWALQVFAANIEDEASNTTRFLVIGRVPAAASGTDKTSLLLSAENRPGALHALIEPFARRDVSMTRIESRPARGAVWEYLFFVDVEGHAGEEVVAAALADVRGRASLCRLLGSYPRAVPR